jgi:hypothetical protein
VASNLADETLTALRRFRNVVLEGPPGTGKTYVVDDVAMRWQKATGRQLGGSGAGEFALTMHPSTSYEDVVEGLRYDQHTGSFRLRDGFIARAVTSALANPDRDFLILLDELNRANVPKVLGDLLLTLEASKRSRWDGASWIGGVSVTLPYSGNLFSVPSNLYVLATMNTSDRSIAPLDAALRRRFAFVRVTPLRGEELTKALTSARGSKVAQVASTTVSILNRLNLEVLRPVLGPDGELGHSYVFDIQPPLVSDPDLAIALRWASNADVSRAFWTEVRSGNGGSRNQLDLAENGSQGNGGSLELFYPLTTTAGEQASADPARDRRDLFAVWYGGVRYENTRLEYNPPTPGWRLFLEGASATSDKFSAIASQVQPVPGHDEARALEYRILLWFVRQDGDLILEKVDATPERVAALRELSIWSDRSQAGPSGREFGPFDMQKLRGGNTDEPRLTWRYAILPQLVELAISNGVEDLFDPTRRSAWQATHGAPAQAAALEELDQFLASMSIWLRVVGHDLGKTLTILDEAPKGPHGEPVGTEIENSAPAGADEDLPEDDQTGFNHGDDDSAAEADEPTEE